MRKLNNKHMIMVTCITLFHMCLMSQSISKSSNGYKSVSYKFIILCLPTISAIHTQLINQSITYTVFPLQLKNVLIKLHHKSEKTKN